MKRILFAGVIGLLVVGFDAIAIAPPRLKKGDRLPLVFLAQGETLHKGAPGERQEMKILTGVMASGNMDEKFLVYDPRETIADIKAKLFVTASGFLGKGRLFFGGTEGSDKPGMIGAVFVEPMEDSKKMEDYKPTVAHAIFVEWME